MTSPFHTSLVGFFLQLQQTFTQRVTKDSKPHVMEDFSLLRLPSSFFYYLLHLHFHFWGAAQHTGSFLGCALICILQPADLIQLFPQTMKGSC